MTLSEQMFNDPLIDGHEDQPDFYAEIQAEADSALPIPCPRCDKLDCDCTPEEIDLYLSIFRIDLNPTHPKPVPLQTNLWGQTPTAIIKAPPGSGGDLTYWYERAAQLLPGVSIIFSVQ